MTFLEMQNQVIANAFQTADRPDVKTWLNARYGWLWDLEEWSFKQGTDAVTVTSGSQAVSSVPTDFAVSLALLNSDGVPLRQITEARDFYSLYMDASSGAPEAFTVVGDDIFVGPTSDVTDTGYKLVYQKAPTLMVDDTDEPSIPAHHHIALVFGAKATGLKLNNIPLWRTFDEDFTGAINTMRRVYLQSMRGAGEQMPAYRAEPAQWR